MQEGISTGIVSGAASGLSGTASTLPGMETPDVSVQLRKGQESQQPPPPLYTVLEQRQAPLAPGSLLGTDHVYVMPGQAGKPGGMPRCVLLLAGLRPRSWVRLPACPAQLPPAVRPSFTGVREKGNGCSP
jgi:hypothetical protein